MRTLVAIFSTVITLAIFSNIFANGKAESLYKGAWFDIKYPSDFVVKPSMKSVSKSQGYDSAFFVSPDGKVEFYIFSPQWSGDAKDIALNGNTENSSPSETQKKNGREVTYYTITAKNGSYMRSYQQTVESGGSVKWVVGIKYASKKDYDKYKTAYLKFKKSLNQYGD